MSEHELTLVLGGARAGKSAFAEQLAASYGRQVLYVATAEIKDDEMRARIALHRAQRPADWQTLEVTHQVGATLLARRPTADAILIDCLTLLVSNILLSCVAPDAPTQEGEEQANAALSAELEVLLRAQAELQRPMVVVSNEVGLGLVPPYPLGRLYRDLLGRANQRMAAAADRVYLLVAGLPLTLKGQAGLTAAPSPR